MKVCPKCKKELPISNFNFRLKNGKKTLRSRCRKCEAEDCKKWQSENRQKYLKIKKENREKNLEMYRFYAKRARYIARSPNPVGKFSIQEWKNLKEKYEFKCLCCKKSEPKIKLTPDHIVPTSIGGSDYISNIQPLCMKCNQIKNNKVINYV